MKTFRVNKTTEVICEWKKTRYGFKHEATLMVNGFSYGFAKCCYYNRTWESFEYETVLRELFRKTGYLTKRQQTIFFKKASGQAHKAVKDQFRMVAAVTQIGEILTQDQKDRNDWKKRMLQAGIPGLIMPEDWGQLSEQEKEARLNNVISELKK